MVRLWGTICQPSGFSRDRWCPAAEDSIMRGNFLAKDRANSTRNKPSALLKRLRVAVMGGIQRYMHQLLSSSSMIDRSYTACSRISGGQVPELLSFGCFGCLSLAMVEVEIEHGSVSKVLDFHVQTALYAK